MDKYWSEKLRFADTDLCKFANVAMRSRQYCTSLTKTPAPAVQNQWNVYDQACAIHHWLRQTELHHGFYVWYARQPSLSSRGHANRLNGPREPQGRPEFDPPPDADDNADDIKTGKQFEVGLTHELWLQRVIITKTHGTQNLQTDKLLQTLKHPMKNRRVAEPAKAIKEAVGAPCNAKILERLGDEKSTAETAAGAPSQSSQTSKPRKAAGGWEVIHCRKRPWSAIQQEECAKDLATRLKLSPDLFDACK
jgi:hypothetical protein